MGTASKLVGSEPAGEAADNRAGPSAGDTAEWTANHADATAEHCTCASTSGCRYCACDGGLWVIEVEGFLAFGTDDVGHRGVVWYSFMGER